MRKYKYEKLIGRVLLLLFVVEFIVSYMPRVSAATASSQYVSEALKIHKSPAWTISEYNSEIDKLATRSGYSTSNIGGDWLNPHVYLHYGDLVVYGMPHGEFMPTTKGRTFKGSVQGEFKNLGYDLSGNSITNNDYYGSTPDGKFTTYKEVNWNDINNTSATWEIMHPTQVNYLLNTVFEDGDFKPTSTVTKPPLLKTWLPQYTKKAYVQSAPGLWRSGSIHLRYNNYVNWNTIDYPEMGCKFNGSISADGNTYKISKEDSEVSINITMTLNVTDASKISLLSKAGFELYGESSTQNINGQSSYVAKFTKKLSRNDLNIGNNTVKLGGTVSLTSIYQETEELQVSTSVDVQVEEASEPYVTASVSADPNKIQYIGQDMPVKLNVEYTIGSISGVSKISNITVTISGEGTFQATKTLTGELVRNTTIPKSFMGSANKKDKVYEVLVACNLTDGTVIRGATSVAVRITTEPPEPEKPPKPDNEPPEVELDAPTEVKAGEEFSVWANVGGIEVRIHKLGRSIGIKKCHPHKFRRTMATVAIDKGMPIEQVQKLLGHEKIDTTLHYAMVKQSNVKNAHRKYIG